MQFEDDIDFTTLGWVKPQIDETLLQARQALEAYVEDPADASLMRFCATYLHQVQGTLRMVELYGAAMLTEEMEALAQALLDDKAPDRDEAYTVLMRGLVQLPDYLERVQAGNKDIPVVLLPLLNELRQCRGEAPLAESALFSPNLEHALPADVPGLHAPLPSGDLRQRVATIRAKFQALLAAWLRAPANADFNGLRQALDQLCEISHGLPARRLWWIAGGVLEGLQEGRLDERAAEAARQQFGRVDRSIKAMQDDGEAVLADEDRRDLNQSLLYLIAQGKSGSPRCDSIRKTYALNALLPSAEELEHARGSMAGHNRVLLDTVSQALKEDLLRVKEALDIFLRREGGDAAELAPQAETLRRVGDTLGMLGLGVPRRVVGEQREILEAIAHGQRGAAEDVLMDVAGALLFVDASLDDHIERLGAPAPEEAEADVLPRAEARKIVDALMREAATNLSKVKDDVVAFIESPWAHDRVLGVPALLEEVSGALRMLDMHRPADLLGGVGRFVDNELIADRRIPTAEQMDTLADAMAGIEYYLEAARDSRGGGERILDGTQRSLEALGYWPVPAKREAAVQPQEERPAPASITFASPDLSEAVSIAPGADVSDLVVGASSAPASGAQDLAGLNLVETENAAPKEGEGEGEWVEIEEEIEEPVGSGAAAASFQDAAGIDEDIREVFVEEVGEEIASIREHLPAWKADPENLETLKSVRRSFHTLKGSGRLVGALALGEFSWKVENML
ncbi:MAG TPA: Hpt domain-containing protein, partial [Rhodanobacteraceae bacterium]|nr:Hpt domain-containing protein [Rhodanobacteraceae bacterium]